MVDIGSVRLLSVLSGYLTPRQKSIWGLSRSGLSESKIATRLSISRQAVHKALDLAEGKVLRALLDAAELDRFEVKKVDPIRGILVGFSPGFRLRVFLTYGVRNGIQLWYEHRGQCDGCQRKEECLRMLQGCAEEWGVTLTAEELSLPPTKLAERLFEEAL